MNAADLEQRLSRIATLWTLVRQAHAGSGAPVADAQQRLLERYSGAVYRYLLGAVRDPDIADDLFQEFSLRLLRGDFKNAHPERGRFRNFLKTAVFHLIVDYQKRRRPRQLDSAIPEPTVDAASVAESERQFLASWREEMLDRAWQALHDFEKQTGQPYHAVLRFRTEHPLLSSAELAQQLSAHLGKNYTVNAVRQALHRSREKYAELLLHEVAAALRSDNREELEQELIELELHTYCQKALQKYR